MVLPEATEVEVFDCPTFRVATTAFAAFERDQGAPVVRVKMELEDQEVILRRDGFEPTPETGTHGWTNIRLDLGVSWDEIDELVIASYRLQAPKHLRAALDALLTAAGEEPVAEDDEPVDLEVPPSPADRRVVMVIEVKGATAEDVIDAEAAWRVETEGERAPSRVLHAHGDGRHLITVEYATASDAELDAALPASAALLGRLTELAGSEVVPRLLDVRQADRR